jgi:hypothetical protein
MKRADEFEHLPHPASDVGLNERGWKEATARRSDEGAEFHVPLYAQTGGTHDSPVIEIIDRLRVGLKGHNGVETPWTQLTIQASSLGYTKSKDLPSAVKDLAASEHSSERPAPVIEWTINTAMQVIRAQIKEQEKTGN